MSAEIRRLLFEIRESLAWPDEVEHFVAEIEKLLTPSGQEEPPAPPVMADAAEMLWIVLANVSGGDWTKQTPEWQEAAARWRDNHYKALKAAPPVEPPRASYLDGYAAGVKDTEARLKPASPPVEQERQEWPRETYENCLRYSGLLLTPAQVAGISLLTRDLIDKWREQSASPSVVSEPPRPEEANHGPTYQEALHRPKT